MNRKQAISVVILMLALSTVVVAQDQDSQGREWGGYTVFQSIELGGHIAEVEGNQSMYATFVNVNSGPRLLSQELSMQSRTHQGLLFDNLYVSSFGFGGDPENLARLRISKNKWYNFVGLYRRDKNFFDYDLFANPLNLNAGVVRCGVGCVNNVNPQSLFWFNNSPHLQATTRNMGDFLLTLLPESAISFRLGYARNNTSGTIDTTAGQPFVTVLTEDSGWRSDRYQFGVDVKLFPRTTISGDVFFEHDKNDLAYRNLPQFTLGASGLPVDIGLNFLPSTVNPPCITSAGPPPVLALNTTCTAAALTLTKSGNVRTDIPTGQLSLASNYFRKLDITASGTYSSASSDFRNFNEFYYGSAPTLLTGPASVSRISSNADLGLTYHLSKRWSVSDKFRWTNWREPGALNLLTFTCSHAAAGSTLLSSFLNPCNQATTLFGLITGVNGGATDVGNATTGNFETITNYGTLIGERSYFNTAKLLFQPSPVFSAYAGYRYGRRELNSGTGLTAAGAPLNPPPNISVTNTTTITNVCRLSANPAACTTASLSTGAGVDTEKIIQHTFLLGTTLRPIEAWRINGDLELLVADNAFTDISPRHQQRARVSSTIKVKRWMSVNGGLHFVNSRYDFVNSETLENTTTPLFPANAVNGTQVPFYGHKDHWYYYTLGLSMSPNSKFTFDIGWTRLDQKINSATCMPLASTSFAPAGSLPAVLTAPTTGANACATGTQSWALLLDYSERTNSGYTDISFQPAKRVTLSMGYEVTGDNGRTNWLRSDTGAPLQVFGDVFGNVPPVAGNSVTCPAGITQVTTAAGVNNGCAFAGPFADQPLGPQALTWHKAHGGIAVDVAKGVQFKGVWSYYDDNSKDEVPSLVTLRVVAPRGFHANVGTLSLKYSF